MSKQHTATRNHTRISYVHRGVGSVVLRRFDPACDSFEELTQMLHRSFSRLGSMGLNCTCVDQSALVTRARAMRGDCYVAVCNGWLVGNMTLYTQDGESLCGFYRRDDIASVRQFGVDPAYQSRGIGKSLLAYADHWAAIRGYAELALDTPQPAAHLIEFYRGQGFRINDFVRFAGKQYDSAILSKAPIAFRHLAAWSRRLELPQASVARAA
ncbi:MAG: Histone acetyltransferase HPA2 and related acetyltransferases [Candidatus Burkholderia crenata]|nr:Histone acetyltransferase HPA2 and related acetyltransferase [Candidatus Burkholderia crenata]CAH2809771.1 MAG: Histone acetyltransferase HPA2 and related acetyltransferases [Candidatus Burkholderia crenata]